MRQLLHKEGWGGAVANCVAGPCEGGGSAAEDMSRALACLQVVCPRLSCVLGGCRDPRMCPGCLGTPSETSQTSPM